MGAATIPIDSLFYAVVTTARSTPESCASTAPARPASSSGTPTALVTERR